MKYEVRLGDNDIERLINGESISVELSNGDSITIKQRLKLERK